MIRIHISQIDANKLDAARAIAFREHDGFLLFDNRSREFQLLMDRRQSFEPDPLLEAKQVRVLRGAE
jgi:hypothetical protein